MLSEASMSGGMVLSKTSTETQPLYPPWMSSAAMGGEVNLAHAGTPEVGVVGMEVGGSRQGFTDDFRDGAGVGGHRLHIEVKPDVR